MFTPQGKVWSGWSSTPKSDSQKKNSTPLDDGDGEGAISKGKTVARLDETPVIGSLGENGRRFVAAAEIEDRHELSEKISKLENELFEYQYNMGLLLIEKKDWTSKFEELMQALADAKEALDREQAAHLIAISEVERREENLRKAMGVEKQCVLDLEKALHEMRSQYAEIKFTSDSKLAEANALAASVENRSLEVEAKMHAADAKLAEVSRKSSEIERKLKDLEARENALRRERLSFASEREAQETTLSKQREDLREWEKRLKEGEDRLCESQIILNQREERVNEYDKTFKQKEEDLEGAQKKIDEANLILKKKEEDIISRLASVAEAEALRKNLENKEKELLALEEKLDVRERVEIQKLVDEHNSILDAKKHEFELEMDQKKKSLDESLKNKVIEVEKKEVEVSHMEEKVTKREQALEKSAEKLKEKEKDFESKSKALKEREKSIRAQEKNLDNEKKQLHADTAEMLILKAEVEKIRADIEEQQLKLIEERERLKVTEEERADFLRLQSELRQEIDSYRLHKELLLKEREELKQQRETFEKQWEELDQKQAEINKELNDISEQKEKLDKMRHNEEETLEHEKLATQDYIQRELEALNLAKESFAASMEHEKSVISENAQNEKSEMLHDFELRKRELEIEMQNKQEEMEKKLCEREKLFEEERERELSNINYLREVANREMNEMKLERSSMQKEKQELITNKKRLEEDTFEMRKDIDDLDSLSRKLKDQRERFLKEKERFIGFVEKHKNCDSCGEITREFLHTDLHFSPEMEDAGLIPLPRVADAYLKGIQGNEVASAGKNCESSPGVVGLGSPASGGTMSWFRKCTTKFLNFSPGKKFKDDALQDQFKGLESGDEAVNEGPSNQGIGVENEAEPALEIAGDSFDAQKVLSDNSIRVGEIQELSINDLSNSKGQEAPEDSGHYGVKGTQCRPARKQVLRISKTRSMKAVVEDARAFLRESSEQNEGEQLNGNAENDSQVNEESRGESGLAYRGTSRNGKRGWAYTSQTTASEQNGNESEERSDSVVDGGNKKRRQKVATMVQNPGEKRYNLRPHRKPVTDKTARKSSAIAKDGNADDRRSAREESYSSKAAPAPSVAVASENGGSTHMFEKMAETADGNGDVVKVMTEATVLSEEVDGTPQRTGEFHGGDEDEEESSLADYEYDEEPEHPGEASIGKKLWKFFTT
ncbi:hypothetical protein RJ641_006571 [Dillenia turbinata]|uniref:Uncharacterized protein n=1 Tax=Dillenia turbinata TaxID=194707 RepID=A0AAN8V5S6_9MAGN